MAQGSNIGSVGDLVGCELVVLAVTCEEGDVDPLVGENLDRRCGLAPGSDGVEGSDGLESLKLAEASAANDGDVDGLCERISASLSLSLGGGTVEGWRGVLGMGEAIDALSKVVGRSPILTAAAGSGSGRGWLAVFRGEAGSKEDVDGGDVIFS